MLGKVTCKIFAFASVESVRSVIVNLPFVASIVESLKLSYLLNGTLLIVGLDIASLYLSCVLSQKPFIRFHNDDTN